MVRAAPAQGGNNQSRWTSHAGSRERVRPSLRGRPAAAFSPPWAGGRLHPRRDALGDGPPGNPPEPDHHVARRDDERAGPPGERGHPQARLALERMRLDIHCAHSVGAPLANSSGGTTIILNETNASGLAECPGLLAQNASSVQWCTVPYPGSTTRYRLFREDDPSVECSGSLSTFQVDYLSQSSVWATPGCTGGAVPTVSVALGRRLTGYDGRRLVRPRRSDRPEKRHRLHVGVRHSVRGGGWLSALDRVGHRLGRDGSRYL